MEYYFKTDFQIVETFTDSTGVPIDLNDFDFELIYQTTGVYNYKAFKKGEVLINCSIDTVDSSKLIVVFQNHKLSCGQLHREIKIKALNPLFEDYQQIMTHPFTEIYLVQNGGDQTTGYASAGIPIVLPYSETIVTDLSDTDYFFGMSLSLKSFIKITWLDIKAKLKTYFDTLFEPKNSNIQSHISDTGIHVTSVDKSNFHSHSNKSDLDNVSGSNTGDETAQTIKNKLGITTLSGSNTGDQASSDFDIKDLTDSTGLRASWTAKIGIEDLQDATTKDDIIDADKVNYLDSENNFSLVKTTWLNIKSKLKKNILEPVQVTYEELYALKQSNNLTQNQLYEITDYRNRYQQAVSKEILTSETEPLIIKAISNNSFSTKAYSKLYPQDEIYYNFENTMDENPILAPGADRGFIFRRIDTKQRNDFPFDFRNIKFRRWQVTGNEWDAATVYSSRSIVKRNGFLYIGVGNNNVGIDPELNNNTITTLDSYAWIKCNFADMSYVSDTPTGLIGTLQFAVTGLYQDYLMFSTEEIYSMAKNNIALYDWHLQSSHNDRHLFAAFNTVFKKESLNPSNTYTGVTNNQIGGDFHRNTILWDFSANKTSVTFYINLICDIFDNNLIHAHFRYNYTNKWVTHGTFTGWDIIRGVFGDEINASSFLCYGGFDNSIIAGKCFRVLSTGDVRNIISHKNIAYSDFSGIINNAVFKKEIAYTKSHNSLSNSTINARLDNVTFEGGIVYLTIGEAEIKDVVFGKNISNADLTTLIYPITPCRIEIVEGTPDKLCIKYLNADGRQCYSIVGLDGTILEAENVYETETNKESDVETYKESITKYPTLKGLYDWAVGKFVQLSQIVTSWTATPTHDNIPSEKLVKDSLNLKADITPANGSTSALRALFIARGYDAITNTYHCVYNTNTGYYEMNGLTDITEAEISVIYNYSTALHNANLKSALSFVKCRTFYPLKVISNNSYDISYICQGNSVLEAFFINLSSSNVPTDVSAMIGAFYTCVNLKVVNALRVRYATTAANAESAFYNCQKLEECYLHGVRVGFSFEWSPLLSLASLQYLVTNRLNGTTRITITVHPTTWSKLNDAVNYQEWNALLVDAVANQYIYFASA